MYETKLAPEWPVGLKIFDDHMEFQPLAGKRVPLFDLKFSDVQHVLHSQDNHRVLVTAMPGKGDNKIWIVGMRFHTKSPKENGPTRSQEENDRRSISLETNGEHHPDTVPTTVVVEDKIPEKEITRKRSPSSTYCRDYVEYKPRKPEGPPSLDMIKHQKEYKNISRDRSKNKNKLRQIINPSSNSAPEDETKGRLMYVNVEGRGTRRTTEYSLGHAQPGNESGSYTNEIDHLENKSAMGFYVRASPKRKTSRHHVKQSRIFALREGSDYTRRSRSSGTKKSLEKGRGFEIHIYPGHNSTIYLGSTQNPVHSRAQSTEVYRTRSATLLTTRNDLQKRISSANSPVRVVEQKPQSSGSRGKKAKQISVVSPEALQFDATVANRERFTTPKSTYPEADKTKPNRFLSPEYKLTRIALEKGAKCNRITSGAYDDELSSETCSCTSSDIICCNSSTHFLLSVNKTAPSQRGTLDSLGELADANAFATISNRDCNGLYIFGFRAVPKRFRLRVEEESVPVSDEAIKCEGAEKEEDEADYCCCVCTQCKKPLNEHLRILDQCIACRTKI